MSYGKPMQFIPIRITDIIHATNRAVLVRLMSDDREQWIPLSALSTPDADAIDRGEYLDELNITEWFVERENL